MKTARVIERVSEMYFVKRIFFWKKKSKLHTYFFGNIFIVSLPAAVNQTPVLHWKTCNKTQKKKYKQTNDTKFTHWFGPSSWQRGKLSLNGRRTAVWRTVMATSSIVSRGKGEGDLRRLKNEKPLLYLFLFSYCFDYLNNVAERPMKKAQTPDKQQKQLFGCRWNNRTTCHVFHSVSIHIRYTYPYKKT